MYLNDAQRSDFYSTIGLDAIKFDQYVIIKTNQSAGTLFPIIYDVENPNFFGLLDKCLEANESLIAAEKENTLDIIKFVQKIPGYLKMTSSLIQLFFLPDIETKYIWTENI
jgi:magnesium-protoporphyrin IX monomethyl ester (oxidative) cyclase